VRSIRDRSARARKIDPGQRVPGGGQAGPESDGLIAPWKRRTIKLPPGQRVPDQRPYGILTSGRQEVAFHWPSPDDRSASRLRARARTNGPFGSRLIRRNDTSSDRADSQKRGATRDRGIPREIPWTGLSPNGHTGRIVDRYVQ